ncbi:hypothetical protein ACL02O_03690 [Micromonospora sp. MS34]|uniref:hypothetical protein n=1 Tax=Micromonospora sp. MS34 TaxID=3385971 RepID=UPI0039A0327E
MASREPASRAGYQFGVSEGIHGWLAAAETAELAVQLDRLDLPRYEPAFATMTDRRKRDGFTDDELSYVRTVATIAAGAGRALWGNDVSAEAWGEFGVSR